MCHLGNGSLGDAEVSFKNWFYIRWWPIRNCVKIDVTHGNIRRRIAISYSSSLEHCPQTRKMIYWIWLGSTKGRKIIKIAIHCSFSKNYCSCISKHCSKSAIYTHVPEWLIRLICIIISLWMLHNIPLKNEYKEAI